MATLKKAPCEGERRKNFVGGRTRTVGAFGSSWQSADALRQHQELCCSRIDSGRFLSRTQWKRLLC